MRFSEHYGINRTGADDWFDPHLTIDTKLFVDPFLLLRAGGGWAEGHAELLGHFEHCYRLVAAASSPQSGKAKAARRLLKFPEPYEVGLGYTASGTRGAGSSEKFAASIADGIAVALAAGLDDVEHIEEIGILNKSFGPDRISDAVCNVLKGRLITYTQEVAQRHDVPVKEHYVRNVAVNLESARWIDDTISLPTNPETDMPIILVPKRLLRDLPTLNAGSWWNSSINADVRDEFNLTIGQKVNKTTIVEFARRNADRVRRWAREQTSRTDLHGYDFEKDPLGVVQWDKQPVEYAASNPLAPVIESPATPEELAQLISMILDQFKHFIEEQRGWSLLWNDDRTEKPEEAVQLMFLGMAQHYLRLYDVELDREVELGRGPVDFKASRGASLKALIEIKKEHNGKFWNGLDKQLPTYLKSDGADAGWYAAVRYRNNPQSQKRMNELPARVEVAAAEAGKDIRYCSINARRPPSASKL